MDGKGSEGKGKQLERTSFRCRWSVKKKKSREGATVSERKRKGPLKAQQGKVSD